MNGQTFFSDYDTPKQDRIYKWMNQTERASNNQGYYVRLKSLQKLTEYLKQEYIPLTHLSHKRFTKLEMLQNFKDFLDNPKAYSQVDAKDILKYLTCNSMGYVHKNMSCREMASIIEKHIQLAQSVKHLQKTTGMTLEKIKQVTREDRWDLEALLDIHSNGECAWDSWEAQGYTLYNVTGDSVKNWEENIQSATIQNLIKNGLLPRIERGCHYSREQRTYLEKLDLRLQKLLQKKSIKNFVTHGLRPQDSIYDLGSFLNYTKKYFEDKSAIYEDLLHNQPLHYIKYWMRNIQSRTIQDLVRLGFLSTQSLYELSYDQQSHIETINQELEELLHKKSIKKFFDKSLPRDAYLPCNLATFLESIQHINPKLVSKVTKYLLDPIQKYRERIDLVQNLESLYDCVSSERYQLHEILFYSDQERHQIRIDTQKTNTSPPNYYRDYPVGNSTGFTPLSSRCTPRRKSHRVEQNNFAPKREYDSYYYSIRCYY